MINEDLKFYDFLHSSLCIYSSVYDDYDKHDYAMFNPAIVPVLRKWIFF